MTKVQTSEELGQEPAFSSPYVAGMSKREYFAAKAMHGILVKECGEQDLDVTVKASIKVADMLLKQLTEPL